MTLRAKDIPLNEFPCALKTEQKINHKTNISKSEDVLSLTHLERKRLAPGFFFRSTSTGCQRRLECLLFAQHIIFVITGLIPW